MADGEGGALRELLAVFGFGVDTADLKKGKGELEEFFKSVKRIGTGIAAAFAVTEIFEFANSQAELLDKIDDTANALGISTDRVQEFRFAAKALGDDQEKLLNMMGRLQVAQQGAANGSKGGAAAFDAMGIKVKDANGHFKAADELFLDVADGIAKQTDASKAAAIATQLFGRGGRELLPFLKEGRDGFKELVDQYKELGGGYTRDAIEAGGKYQMQTARLGLVITNLKNGILTGLLPVLSGIVDVTVNIVHGFIELAKRSNLLQSIFVVLGAAATMFAIKMAIASWPVLAIAAAIAAIVLVVDDLITMFQGGESVIGDAIDKVFGKDAHVDTVRDLKEAWVAVRAAMSDLGVVIGPIWDFFKFIVDHLEELGSILGDKLGKKDFTSKGERLAADFRDRGGVGDVNENSPAWKRAKAATEQGSGAKLFPTQAVPGSGESLFRPSLPVAAGGGRSGGGSHTSSQHDVTVNVKHDPGVVVETVHRIRKSERRASAATLERAPSGT